jgi:hypothetical protein
MKSLRTLLAKLYFSTHRPLIKKPRATLNKEAYTQHDFSRVIGDMRLIGQDLDTTTKRALDQYGQSSY